VPNNTGQRLISVRSPFDAALENAVAKPSGLGMVSISQHIAGSATEARKRPGAARFIATPRRAADGREPSPWSCGT